MQQHAPPIPKAAPVHLQFPIPRTEEHQSEVPLGDFIKTRQVLDEEESKRFHRNLMEKMNQAAKQERAERGRIQKEKAERAKPKPPPPTYQTTVKQQPTF